jgi:hypothetical protein
MKGFENRGEQHGFGAPLRACSQGLPFTLRETRRIEPAAGIGGMCKGSKSQRRVGTSLKMFQALLSDDETVELARRRPAHIQSNVKLTAAGPKVCA